jgi:flagellar motor switch protein FliG
MAPQKDKLDGVHRTAILLMCLGEKVASSVMSEMSDEEIFKITRAMSEIEHIPEDIKTAVIADFELSSEAQAGLVIKGQDFAKKTIAGTGNEERVSSLMKQFVSGTETRPLETIAKMQPAMVAGLIEHEHPQTIALVLSTQTPDHASTIISQLPEEMQTDVVYRIATIDSVSPEVIDRIEEALHREIGVVAGAQEQRQMGGIPKVVEILDRMENNLDADILDNLEEVDPDMVDEIRKQMFTFEDLNAVDGRSLQMILREVNNDSLTLALKTASDELRDKIFGNMSSRAADMIRDDLEALGPVRLSEVEAMQQTIVKIAMKLEEEGKLVLGKGGGDELV